MVDRLFWRAGFGPSEADRSAWVGKRWVQLVDHLTAAPNEIGPGVDPTYSGAPIDPTVSDTQLAMEWLNRMVRATNPLAERLTFFWSRHWAISTDDGVTQDYAYQYAQMLRRYGDLGRYPDASYRNLTYEVSESPAMLRYLNGYRNQKAKPDENYGREFLELFCLGITDAAGNPNYTEADVAGMARSFTGWVIDTADPANPRGRLDPARFDTGQKTILGATGPFTSRSAADVVLANAKHAPFLVRKLWHEFIVAEPDDRTVAQLVAVYTAGGALAIRPLVRRILLDPAIFESLSEPNMIKPPVVYAAGVVRTTGAPIRDTWQTASLSRMGQLPYNPPNVAGWEGGLSWMSTNAVQARFDFVIRCLHLLPALPDITGETAGAAFDRAWRAVGRPWLSAASRSELLAVAAKAPAATPGQRLGRQNALRALILGGPDGQVM